MKLSKQVMSEVLNSSNVSFVTKSINDTTEMDKYAVISTYSTQAAKVVIPIKGDQYRPIEVSTKQVLASQNILVFAQNGSIRYLLDGYLSDELERSDAAFALRYYSKTKGGVKVKKDHGWMTKEKFYLWLIKQGVLDVLIKTWFPEMTNLEVKESVLDHKGLMLIGFDEKEHSNLLDIFDDSIKMLKKHKFQDLVYGKVFLVPKSKAGGKFTTFADYVNKDDSIRVFDAATKHKLSHPHRTFVHELGHRYYYKKLNDQQRFTIQRKYSEIMYSHKIKKIDQEVELKAAGQLYKIGDKVTDKKHGECEYAGAGLLSSNGRKTVHKFYILDGQGKRTSRFFSFDSLLDAKTYFDKQMSAATGDDGKGEESKDGDEWLPTRYSQTTPVEWFAEIFSFAIQKNTKEVLDWIRGL